MISYLVYAKAGAKDRLTASVRELAACEALPADNQDLLVVVAESADGETAGELEHQLLTLDGCCGVSLVAAFETEGEGE